MRRGAALVLVATIACGGARVAPDAKPTIVVVASARASADPADAGPRADAAPPSERARIIGRASWPQRLLVDDANVYALAYGDGPLLVAIPKSGGEHVELLPGEGAHGVTPWAALVDGGERLFVTRTVSTEQPRLQWIVIATVLSVPKRGGRPLQFAASHPAPRNVAVRGIAVDERFAYWLKGAVRGDEHPIAGDRLVRAPRAGGAPTVLATGLRGATEIAIDHTHVYVALVNGSGRIVRVPIGGGSPTTVIETRRAPMSLTADAKALYWVEGDALVAIDKEGKPRTVLDGFDATDTYVGKSYAIDGDSVYWTTTKGVFRSKTSGGPRETLDEHGDKVGPIAVDATHVYYAVDDAIMKLAK